MVWVTILQATKTLTACRIGRDRWNYSKNIATQAIPASTTINPKRGMEKINVLINGLIFLSVITRPSNAPSLDIGT